MKAKPKEKVKIKAIHDADLKPFLEKLGLLEELKNRRLLCSFCNCTLTIANFGGIFKENSEIKPFCQKTTCYLEVLKKKNAEKEE